MSRHIDFEGIENFRDFGGYDTECGRRVRAGRLYRSGHHHLATAADLARLGSLGVVAIADLRQPSERTREPSRRWEGFAAEVIDADLPSTMPDWVEALHTAALDGDWWYQSTLSHYRLHAFEPRHVAVFRRLFHVIADGQGAVVVHCAAGKDRTGVACALVHHVAGTPRETMIADYLLTNDEDRMARKMVHTGDFVEKVTGRRPTEEALRVAVQAYPAYLDAFFDSIRERCGSVDGYLQDVLGIDAAFRERIRAQLLVDR
jgi:protein-tyrosine phosphatase